jgi:hypothetical protein
MSSSAPYGDPQPCLRVDQKTEVVRWIRVVAGEERRSNGHPLDEELCATRSADTLVTLREALNLPVTKSARTGAVPIMLCDSWLLPGYSTSTASAGKPLVPCFFKS